MKIKEHIKAQEDVFSADNKVFISLIREREDGTKYGFCIEEKAFNKLGKIRKDKLKLSTHRGFTFSTKKRSRKSVNSKDLYKSLESRARFTIT